MSYVSIIQTSSSPMSAKISKSITPSPLLVAYVIFERPHYYFWENHIQKHFVKKQIIFLSYTFGRKISNACVRCYTLSSIVEDDREFQDLFYFSHIKFEGSPETLFDNIFFKSTNWCEICKITPLINIYDKYDCSQMHGDRIHNNANVLNEYEEFSDVTWMEKIDVSYLYTYI